MVGSQQQGGAETLAAAQQQFMGELWDEVVSFAGVGVWACVGRAPVASPSPCLQRVCVWAGRAWAARCSRQRRRRRGISAPSSARLRVGRAVLGSACVARVGGGGATRSCPGCACRRGGHPPPGGPVPRGRHGWHPGPRPAGRLRAPGAGHGQAAAGAGGAGHGGCGRAGGGGSSGAAVRSAAPARGKAALLSRGHVGAAARVTPRLARSWAASGQPARPAPARHIHQAQPGHQRPQQAGQQASTHPHTKTCDQHGSLQLTRR